MKNEFYCQNCGKKLDSPVLYCDECDEKLFGDDEEDETIDSDISRGR